MYKLISRNIWIKINNNVEVVNFLKEKDYDIICLQEATTQVSEWVLNQYKSYDIIQDEVKYPHSFFWDVRESDWFHHKWKSFWWLIRQWNIALSKYPIKLAENKFYRRHFERRIDWSNFRQLDHWRSLTKTIIDFWDNKKAQIINVHWCYSDDKKDNERTLNQSKFILEKVKEHNISTIVVWDFNVDNTTESIDMIRAQLSDLTKEHNIQSTRPKFDDWSESSRWNQVIDFIFVSDDIEVKNFWVIKNTISDHFALEIEFSLRG